VRAQAVERWFRAANRSWQCDQCSQEADTEQYQGGQGQQVLKWKRNRDAWWILGTGVVEDMVVQELNHAAYDCSPDDQDGDPAGPSAVYSPGGNEEQGAIG